MRGFPEVHTLHVAAETNITTICVMKTATRRVKFGTVDHIQFYGLNEDT